MIWPTGLFPGKVLLLGERGNFYTSYIRGTLEICGVSLVGAGHAPAEALANLDEKEFSAIVGCVAVDLAADTIAALGMHQWAFPVLFVGGYTGCGFPGAYAWMQAPFASYQVIETLLRMLPVAPGTAAWET